jgi:hypothetical protein
MNDFRKRLLCDLLCAQPAIMHSLLDLGEDFRVLEQVVLLRKNSICLYRTRDEPKGKTCTSSPTLIALPPHPGSSTLSPAFTVVGMIFPFLSGAPGPTAITVASGSGTFVADVGRKMPVAVF